MKISLLLILISVSVSASALNPDTARAELRALLKQRKELFDEYSTSINKKSGIFGNKTKNDIRSSQEKLVEIVNADNKIMNSLHRTLDFRNFEKVNMSYDATSFESRIKNLIILNDTLSKRIGIYTTENKIYRAEIKKLKLYNWLLLLAIAAAGIWYAIRFWRKKT